LFVSRLFQWYRRDFGGRRGVADFLIHYLPEDERTEWLTERARPRFRYLPYHWSLNNVT
jgi:hypothetical protein